jgi:PEP-CTERM motif
MPVLVRRIPRILRLRPGALGALAALAILLSAAPARAGAIPSIAFNPGTVTVAPGGTGTVELDLVIPAGDSIDLGGFNINIITTSPDITFTGGTSSTTATYILSGNSSGAIFSNFNGNNSGEVNDLAASLSNPPFDGQTVGAGTWGLALFTFSVSPTAMLGPVTLTIDATTNFSDENGMPISVDTSATGTILISNNSVPEPSSMMMVGTAALSGLGLWARRRRSPR